MSKGTRPCVKCGRNRAERFFTSARGRTCTTCLRKSVAQGARAARMMAAYGLTREDYAAILAYQDGKCAICRRTPRYNLDIDHCHKTGVVRGALCKPCNRRLLPSVRDDVMVLARAINYLKRYPAYMALRREVIVPGSVA